MPIPNGTLLNAIPGMLAGNIANYNAPANHRGAFYNQEYDNYIQTRTAGVAAFGSLSGWVINGGASHAIWALRQHAFLALDQTGGSTGIPRLIDKGLW